MTRLFLSLILIFCASSLAAVPNIIVEQYGVEAGLPNNIVYCSLKDSDGMMWFGTWYGLCSFDGQKFTSYNNRDRVSSDIPPRKIETIVEDKNGYLWVKTVDRKLYVFDKKNESFHAVNNTVKNYVSNIQVIKIEPANDGEVLILTKDKNLLCSYETVNEKVNLKLLHNAARDINPQNSRLNHNVLFENDDCLGWIGKDYTILKCEKSEKLRISKRKLLANRSITSLTDFTCAFVNGNSLWLGDKSGFIYQIDFETGKILRKRVSGVTEAVQSLFVNEKGDVFLEAKGQGVFEYQPRRNQTTHFEFTVNDNKKVSVFEDKLRKLWVVEENQSIVYFDPKTSVSKRFAINNGLDFTHFKYQDAGLNGLFFLTSVGEMLMFNRNDLSMIPMNQLKPFEDIKLSQQFYDQMLDKDGILWIASTSKGIYRVNFPKNHFHVMQLEETVSDDTHKSGTRAIFEDKNHNVWVGDRNGILYQLNRNKTVVHCYESDQEHVGSAYHIMQSKTGDLWISTKGDGLVKASPDVMESSKFLIEKFKHNPNDDLSLSNNNVYYSYCDSKGRIWVGTMGGGLNLMVNKNGKIIFKNKFNSFKHYPSYGQYLEVRNIVEDKDGRIWVGTTDGLMSFDGNFKSEDDIKFETYRNQSLKSNIADNDIYVLFKDQNSQIWVSVFGGGLNRLVRYDKDKKCPVFKSYGVQQGLNSDVIVSIVEDHQNNLWLASEGGLSRYDMKNHVFRNFDKYDGFSNVKLEESSALLTSDGELWFGCKEGILMFDPNELSSSSPVHKTFIVDFKISNKDLSEFKDHPIISGSIKYAKSITLKHNQSMFSIEFAALNYYDPSRTSYKYILEGYEKEWHYNGKNRNASYSNVPPGEYTFRVVSMDEASPDSQSEQTLQIIILPPWWKSWWAYLVYAILTVVAIYFVLRLFYAWTKMKNEVYISERISELKIKFFTNISHELRTPLSLIKGPIQELKENENLTPKGEEYVQLMERNTDQMQRLVNQLLDFRKVQNGKMKLHVSLINLVDFLPYFQKEFHVLAEEKKIDYTFSLPIEAVNVWVDKERIGIVIRNVISNAFKYTPVGGKINVGLGFSNDNQKIQVKVSDTGIGIEKNKLQEIFERFVQGGKEQNSYYSGTGIGLALSKEIMLLHHGNIVAESNPSGGAVFILELLKGKDHFVSNEVDFYLSDQTVSVAAESIGEESVQPLDDDEKEEELDSNSLLPILLFVEDNRDMANMVKMQLEDRYKVYTAANGVEGLKKIYLYHPDIVVTDQMMPEMDGLELLTNIRQDFQISHIPVIILTAKDGDEAKTLAISKGANAYITKPFSKDYLIARTEQLLNERKLFRERLWTQRDKADTNDYEDYLESKDVQLLNQIHKVIEENMSNSDFNMDTIAAGIGLSRSAFFKKLKSLTGLAPVDLVKEIRLNKSTELLKNTDMSISEIAYAVGFKESGYYTKCFRKKYNQTPSEYITQWRKG